MRNGNALPRKGNTNFERIQASGLNLESQRFKDRFRRRSLAEKGIPKACRNATRVAADPAQLENSEVHQLRGGSSSFLFDDFNISPTLLQRYDPGSGWYAG